MSKIIIICKNILRLSFYGGGEIDLPSKKEVFQEPHYIFFCEIAYLFQYIRVYYNTLW